ncbi:MAG TPA: amidohydrolase, partial [Anseongella sp.]|nr:amidohydrolase [Anseongella sp.]
MKRTLLAACLSIACLQALAQQTFPGNGVQDKRPGLFAFTNATLVVSADRTVQKGTLLVRKGRIEAVGTNIPIPEGAVTIDLDGKYIYPSLIDLYTSYGLPARPENDRSWNQPPQFLSPKEGAFGWNEAIRAEYAARDHFSVNEKDAEKLREQGFGAVLSHNKDGIARGSSVFVTLGEERDNKELLRDAAAAHYSFNKGSSRNDYPSSLMGAVALLRQTYYDARWYAGRG